MSSRQGYQHTQDNRLQVVHYTHLAKNYFEEFMLTDPNLAVHSNFAFIRMKMKMVLDREERPRGGGEGR
jgi:hypothetical protein